MKSQQNKITLFTNNAKNTHIYHQYAIEHNINTSLENLYHNNNMTRRYQRTKNTQIS